MKVVQSQSGGELVVEALMAQGVDRITCVPGESFLPVLDAVVDRDIELIACRHEAGAANMAVASAKLNGKVGVVAVSRGPGAMHAAIAVHTAQQDALPLIVLVGQVALRDRGRGGFQEVDFQQAFGGIAKWVASLDTLERIPETVARAVRVATTGRPGPVVLEMPEDILACVGDAMVPPRLAPVSSSPSSTQQREISQLLTEASSPILLLGRSEWNSETAAVAVDFARHFQLPIIAGFRCQDYIDNRSDVYAGHLGFNADEAMLRRLEQSDLILSVGGHFGDVETQGYSILSPKNTRRVIHLAATEGDLDRYLPATVAVIGSPLEFFRGVMGSSDAVRGREFWVQQLREEQTVRSTPTVPDDVLAAIVAWIDAHAEPDTVVANGAGNYAIWVHKYFRYKQYGTQLAPASGAMGFGLPAGIAAAHGNPHRPVYVFAGDGCFTMALPELSLLVESDLNLTIIVVNNGAYGTIRMHQDRAYPGRESGTALKNPNFSALAQAYGLQAQRVSTVDEFIAFQQSATGPRLIEVCTAGGPLVPSQLPADG
ncbi:thiamine pyrophosphate-dependent enzyme [Leucobacter albus]|uniref:Thiamine pyrophosphate-dependent enzyme n=1 Tax=Leucobacter albus TaxID=272210 RepID=A0ABW3TNP4_9MICO